MPVALKWFLWILLVLFGLFVLFWVYFRFFMHFGDSPEEIAARIKKAPYPVTAHTYKASDRTMRYFQGGKEGQPAVIFVHGSPGNWEAWEKYLTDSLLCQEARIIAVDRLGYGGSTPGIPVASLEEHAASLRPLVESLHAVGPVILVGHSMGGPIIARAAMDYPTLVDGLLILAGSADPALEKVRGIQHFIKHKATRWLIPPDLDMSNRELLPHAEHLALMTPRWNSLAMPVTIMQGKKDALVPWKNAEYMQGLMQAHPPKMVWFEDENHFIPWTQQAAVRAEIMSLLQAAPRR